MKTWQQAIRDGAVSGSVASVLSTAVLGARGQQEDGTPYAPTNAISHWFWGDRAAGHDEPSVRYTAVGYAIHHASATLWAVLYEKWFGEKAERGEILPAIAGGAAVAGLACFADYKLTPQQTEGPYFSDFLLNRSDIRSDPTDGSVKSGVPLALALRVHAVDNGRCTPLPNAIVDVWHCDAAGVYSDAIDSSVNTRGKKFLRGYQVTDANGAVRFTTIYPGQYPGRTVHVHFKVRTKARSGRDMEFTSQLYFPDSITERVHAGAPYARSGRHGQSNESDGLFRRGGRLLMLDPVDAPGGGYAASFDIGIALA